MLLSQIPFQPLCPVLGHSDSTGHHFLSQTLEPHAFMPPCIPVPQTKSFLLLDAASGYTIINFLILLLNFHYFLGSLLIHFLFLVFYFIMTNFICIFIYGYLSLVMWHNVRRVLSSRNLIGNHVASEVFHLLSVQILSVKVLITFLTLLMTIQIKKNGTKNILIAMKFYHTRVLSFY